MNLDGSYSCMCDEGFIGMNCLEIDVCYYNFCENNLICVRNGSIVKCLCVEGYYGELCSFYDSCRD